MGKRAAKKAPTQRRIYKLPKFFPCPYCGQNDSIKVTLSSKTRTASVSCKKCGISTEKIAITAISAPVDVYDDWMDQVRLENQHLNPHRKKKEIPRQDDIVDEPIVYESRLISQSRNNAEDIDDEIELSSEEE